jgi:type VI secretion system secreted protein Hcp
MGVQTEEDDVAAQDHFLKITGIQGESRDATHEDEIEVDSWSWGLARPTNTGPGGAGKATFRELSIQKKVDRSSPMLAQGCAKGEHFKEAVLASRRAEGPNFATDFLVIKLFDVVISRYEEVAEAQSLPMDSIDLLFSRIEYRYTLQKADGTLDAPVVWSWDLKAGKRP